MEPEARRTALRLLSNASKSLASSFDLSAILPPVARSVVNEVAEFCIIGLEASDTGPAVHVVAHRDPAHERRMKAAPPALYLTSAGDEDDAHHLGASQLAVTLSMPGRRFGELIVGNAAGSLSVADRKLVKELGARISLAVANAHLYHREKRLAHTLQTALLPTELPMISGSSYSATYVPASNEAEVGGDWYDAFPLPDGRVAISIGDVAGHGLQAAVVMGEVRQTLRVAAMHHSDPGAVLDLANTLLLSRGEPLMVTAVFGIYDGKQFTYATAGHPPPLISTHNGCVQRLPAGGIPLGVDKKSDRNSWTVSLTPGSLLVLYTDGLIEYGRDPILGATALDDAVEQTWTARPLDPALAIRKTALNGHQSRDDVAILTLAVADEPIRELDLRYSAVPVAGVLVRRALEGFADAVGLSTNDSFSLRIAVGEAVNNAIEHAYRRGQGGMFGARIALVDGAVAVTITDDGRWRPARDEGRGFGLPIIRALTKNVEVNLTSQGTTVSFHLELEPSPSVRTVAGS